MKNVIHRAIDRGKADHGWLQANFSFSFANYYDSNKTEFGSLRVLNDDIIQSGMGFGTHPHNNMEIISIPLKGSLKHRDSMSNEWIPLHTGEVQVMSAGTGIQHSEMNNSSTDDVNLFQIWILPSRQNVEPRYDQKRFDSDQRKNKSQTLVSSIDNEVLGSLTIHQDALISRIDLDNNSKFEYSLKSENHGLYIMVVSGSIQIGDTILNDRDAMGIYQTDKITMNSLSASEVLFIEVPMK